MVFPPFCLDCSDPAGASQHACLPTRNRLSWADVSATCYDPRYLAGLRLYYQGRYWDSHEEWEEIWRESKGAERHFYQALIQLDAALIHTDRGHWGGVTNLLARSLGHLEQCPDLLLGMDVARLREQLRAYRETILALKDGLVEAFDPSLRPELQVQGVDRRALIAMEEEHAPHPLR
jgi:predicted metal-dependent hydrolase